MKPRGTHVIETIRTPVVAIQDRGELPAARHPFEERVHALLQTVIARVHGPSNRLTCHQIKADAHLLVKVSAQGKFSGVDDGVIDRISGDIAEQLHRIATPALYPGQCRQAFANQPQGFGLGTAGRDLEA